MKKYVVFCMMVTIVALTAVTAWATVGEIIAFPVSTIPDNFLACDGSAVSRSTYSELFDVLGTTYGDGDGSTTFNLPDYRGYFLRGWNAGQSVDPDAASRTDRGDGTTGDYVGTKQGEQFKSHNHGYTYYKYTYPNGTEKLGGAGTSISYVTGSSSGTGGAETRPKNINVMYCIRYQDEVPLPITVDWDSVYNKPENLDIDSTDDITTVAWDDITDKPTNLDTDTTDDFSGSYNDLTDVPVNMDTDSTDDFSGDYNDLTNAPTTIPGIYDSGWFACANGGTYQKTHNLGTTQLVVKVYFSTSANGAGMFEQTQLYNDGQEFGAIVQDITSTTVTVQAAKIFCGWGFDSDGESDNRRWSSGYYRVIVVSIG